MESGEWEEYFIGVYAHPDFPEWGRKLALRLKRNKDRQQVIRVLTILLDLFKERPPGK